VAAVAGRPALRSRHFAKICREEHDPLTRRRPAHRRLVRKDWRYHFFASEAEGRRRGLRGNGVHHLGIRNPSLDPHAVRHLCSPHVKESVVCEVSAPAPAGDLISCGIYRAETSALGKIERGKVELVAEISCKLRSTGALARCQRCALAVVAAVCICAACTWARCQMHGTCVVKGFPADCGAAGGCGASGGCHHSLQQQPLAHPQLGKPRGKHALFQSGQSECDARKGTWFFVLTNKLDDNLLSHPQATCALFTQNTGEVELVQDGQDQEAGQLAES
jgi:hypothetical protein